MNMSERFKRTGGRLHFTNEVKHSMSDVALLNLMGTLGKTNIFICTASFSILLTTTHENQITETETAWITDALICGLVPVHKIWPIAESSPATLADLRASADIAEDGEHEPTARATASLSGTTTLPKKRPGPMTSSFSRSMANLLL